ncbi:phytanoyl-CoA dioxygenase family protein [Mycolicibacterium sp.]|uniref:phytanoyl-CoA dioxygenase family protein n=1 Tax=Mycolicibacterium sp. TaxID=2320850 RepID=UPI003D0EF99C
MTASVNAASSPWLDEQDFALDDFRAQVERNTDLADYPLAAEVRDNVLVYSAATLATADRRTVQAELIRALAEGPGVVVFTEAFRPEVVDRASTAFFAIIEAQRAAGAAVGDHFGDPGANDRIWNAAQKLALHDPEVFAEYYANDALAVICQAWLGPRYQVTSQVNVVNPGGKAQVPHRDYHLGFVPPEQLRAYPTHVHRTSPVLTLQGAVAHCDMPVASGPTMLLPHSQRFPGGYVAFNRPEFIEYFTAHHVQLPLRKGDAVFFNPALYHGAGSNVSADIRRIANLLQISSPFGRAMEALDRSAMVRAVYPVLRAMRSAGRPDRDLENAVVATAEGYAFPTNLDSDQPIGSLAPPSQVDLVLSALEDGLTDEELDRALTAHNERRIP